jgi:hypothetical protein
MACHNYGTKQPTFFFTFYHSISLVLKNLGFTVILTAVSFRDNEFKYKTTTENDSALWSYHSNFDLELSQM